MTDEQHPSDSKMQGKHVDKINVDGQILSADEILARARQRIQAKNNLIIVQLLVNHNQNARSLRDKHNALLNN